MKIEQSQVTKLVITDVERHDPIHVYLEDYGDNQNGRVTISEWGNSWSCFWGSMGSSLIEFIRRINNHYWIGKLDSNLISELEADNDANAEYAKKQVIKLRKDDEIDKYEAREYWDLIVLSDNVKDDCCNSFIGSKLLGLFGDDPWDENWPTIPNPQYLRMESRLNAVREALKQIKVE
ncbi:hypothetical protein J3U92_10285 [Proteus mirabilis]|uniref:hypothetical protein n=1 Tax=Proteus mirabilis TaxID=584 RepID=UPI0020A19BAE|nr:hypothetical protein [Proteus mirabilis]EKV9969805.1 hypothetical protein [Proteus mirabilis]MCW9692313.1 hypothetical protein [Proteus mirabilis]UTA56424.1 hypothetical protein J3U92_10285 [Proteus mirabilis]UTA59746.1 hypothetical protein J3U93_10300 [Proteus mirabilis]UTA63069.1 hypothetical protein J3U94_10310 [Proteus mirabilis]